MVIMLQKEVNMKKILLIAVAVMIPTMAHSAVSVDQTTNSAVLRNNGYSGQTADMVNISKARANGQQYYTQDEVAFKKQNKFVRFWRNLFGDFIDPAQDTDERIHHDIHQSTNYKDL